MPHYRPADASVSPRFTGVRTFMRLPHPPLPAYGELPPHAGAEGALADVDLAIVGVPFDGGASYRPGARFGPEAIRSLSVLLRPYHPGFGLDVFERLSAVDYGDCIVVPGYVEDTLARVTAQLRVLVDTGVTPIILGGDHTISLPSLRALSARHGPLALVHLDAHADTWDDFFGQRYDHGTTFRRAIEEGLVQPERSAQIGLRGSLFGPQDWDQSRRLGLTLWPIADVRLAGLAAVAADVKARAGDAPVYLSFDVDALDPAYAPGTGTPEVGGFSTAEAIDFLVALRGLRLKGGDVVEVAPPYDSAGITAIAAANLALAIVGLVACHRAAATVSQHGRTTPAT